MGFFESALCNGKSVAFPLSHRVNVTGAIFLSEPQGKNDDDEDECEGGEDVEKVGKEIVWLRDCLIV